MESMAKKESWVYDLKSNNWPFGIEEPTFWVEWINNSGSTPIPLDKANPSIIPMAGFAGDNWQFSTFAKKGQPIGVIDLCIECGRSDSFHQIIEFIDWSSESIKNDAGVLAGLCFLSCPSPSPSNNFMLEAGIEMVCRGANAPWGILATHHYFCSLPDNMLKNKCDLLEKPDIPGHELHKLPIPMALILDKNMGSRRHIFFKAWLNIDSDSLCLSRFVGGKAAGGTVLHACVWANELNLLSILLMKLDSTQVDLLDDFGRSASHLSECLGMEECQKYFLTYNARKIAASLIALIE